MLGTALLCDARRSIGHAAHGQLDSPCASVSQVLITIEENSIGGFGDHVLHYLALSGALDTGSLMVRPMVLPDKYIEAASQTEQYEEAGLSSAFIENTARKLLSKKQGATVQQESS